MGDETGFTQMANAKSLDSIPNIGIGMLGYSFMGKAHTNAYKKIPYLMYPPPAVPVLQAICGRNEDALTEAQKRYGYETTYTDYHDMLADDKVQLFDNGGPNNAHAEPCIAAAEAGKHIFCEKPLGRTAEESFEMLQAVNKAGVKNMVAFNYRFVPAVRQIKHLIDEGKLGRIYHFRAQYLQEWIMPHYKTPHIWRLDKSKAGSGALGDLGAHVIDLARFLIGEVSQVSAMKRTFIEERPYPDGSGMGKVDVDDAFISTIAFDNGAMGSVEASRYAAGRKNHMTFEINAENATVRFNLERFNEFDIFWVNEEPKETQGFHNVLVTETHHPWIENWWPHGHIIGWEHTFCHEIAHLLDCIVNDKQVSPYGASFEDGYRNAVICDAIIASSDSKKHIDLQYESANTA